MGPQMWEDMGAIDVGGHGGHRDKISRDIVFFIFTTKVFRDSGGHGATDVGGHRGHRDKISRDMFFFIFMTKVCRDLGRTWGHRLGGHGGHRSRGTAAKSTTQTPITEE